VTTEWIYLETGWERQRNAGKFLTDVTEFLLLKRFVMSIKASFSWRLSGNFRLKLSSTKIS